MRNSHSRYIVKRPEQGIISIWRALAILFISAPAIWLMSNDMPSLGVGWLLLSGIIALLGASIRQIFRDKAEHLAAREPTPEEENLG